MLIKVCGLREPENIRAIEEAGADWMGFIFHEKSPRIVPQCPDYMPKNAVRVGVFVHPTFGQIMQHVKDFGLKAVQLYGDVYPELCQKLREKGLIVVRALPARGDIDKTTHPYRECVDYFLFDTPNQFLFGGTGHRYDFSVLRAYSGQVPFFLSGGIGPESLPDLAAFSHPMWAGIDVNSKFETTVAVKDAAKVKKFIEDVHNTYPEN